MAAPFPLTAEISENGMDQGNLVRLLRNIVADLNEIKTYLNTLRTNTSTLKDDGILGNPTLAIGSTPTAVASAAFEYIINGNLYNKAAVTAGTAPGNDVVPEDLYGAVAFDIGADGTIDAVEAAANATGYASAALAVAAIPAVAADHARMGWVTAIKSDGAFTFGTTQLDAANSTVAYTDAPSIIDNTTTPTALTNTSSLSLTP
jgi:hypothetical protein